MTTLAEQPEDSAPALRVVGPGEPVETVTPAQFKYLLARVARLERERHPPVHHNDITPPQRQVANTVVDATGVPVSQLFATTRGPAKTADARALLCYMLRHDAQMTTSQIGRLVGRTFEAVAAACEKVDAGGIDDLLNSYEEAKEEAKEAAQPDTGLDAFGDRMT